MAPEPDLQRWEAPAPTKEEGIDWAQIPTVDLSLYDTDKQSLIKTLKEALEGPTAPGFFYLVNPGINLKKIRRQFDIGLHAFDGIPLEEKEKYQAPIKEKGSFRGYKLPAFWELKNGVRDSIEHYNFYLNSLDPLDSHPGPLRPFLPEAKDFFNESRQKILRRVLNLLDEVLGLPEGYLWALHDNEGITGDDLLRYMIYNPLAPEDSQKTNGVMLNGHTDFNTVSILVSQPITALQVLMPDNKWRYVKHVDDAFVINIGDQLSWKSGGILRGTMHRVVAPPQDQIHRRRLGIFHFAHFRDGVKLDLLPSQKVKEEGRVIFSGSIPTSDEWEATRIKSYGVTEFIRGEEYDTEVIAGIEVRHYHS